MAVISDSARVDGIRLAKTVENRREYNQLRRVRAETNPEPRGMGYLRVPRRAVAVDLGGLGGVRDP